MALYCHRLHWGHPTDCTHSVDKQPATAKSSQNPEHQSVTSVRRFMGNKEPCVTSQLNPPHIGCGAYWAGPAVVRPLFCAQWASIIACTIFCLQTDFSCISYWTLVGNERKNIYVILKTVTK